MDKLNLPEIDFNIRKNEGNIEIFDIIRKKYIALQPEEWVRQHVIHYLINSLSYPKSMFRVESSLKYNSLDKRSDILVYNRSGQPHLLVECKSYKTKINQAALNQLTQYNKVLNAQYILLTNGINHFCCKKNEQKQYDFIDTIPSALEI